MASSAMRKIFQQGEPYLRIFAVMTRHLHSSTLSRPDEKRAFGARFVMNRARRGRAAVSRGRPAERG